MGDYTPPYVEAAIRAVKDNSLSPEEAATRVVAQCNQCIARSAGDSAHGTQDGDTPGLEGFLWSFWAQFLGIAEDDASMHDQLARILAALKAKGGQGCDGWLLWGEPATWGELILFGPASREGMNGPDASLDGKPLDRLTPRARAVLCGDPPANDPVERQFAQSRKKWLNMNTFLAKLWALDIVDESFFGITTMRMCLEPLSVQSTKGPTAGAGDGDGDGGPQELQIEVAATWVRIAGAKMYSCRDILGPKGNPNWPANHGCPGGSGGTWNGVDGYHPDRWAHWKQIFSEVAQGNWRKNVTDAAQAAVEAMEKFERGASSA